MNQSINTQRNKCVNNYNLSDEDIYLMYMLHTYQRISSDKLASRFGITTSQVRDIIARRSNSGCCG